MALVSKHQFVEVALKLIQISDSTYCIRRQSYVNCFYLQKINSGYTFIDAGMHSDGRDLLKCLKILKIDLEEIQAVLLTHWHNDHSAGLKVLQEVPHIQIFGHPLEFKKLQAPYSAWRRTCAAAVPEWGPLVLLKGSLGFQVQIKKFQPIQKEEPVLEEFIVVPTPGHTEGHLSYYHPSSKTLFAGDALAVIGGKIRFMSRFVTPDLIQARQSMLKILERPIEALCPGHREPLYQKVPEQIDQMLEKLTQSQSWPFFG